MKQKIYIEQAKIPIILLVCSILFFAFYLYEKHTVASSFEDIANLKVRSVDNAIILTWDKPAFQWGSRTELTVHSSEGSDVIPLSQQRSSYTFKKGTHATMYTFSLQRTDADGNAGQIQTGEGFFLDWDELPELPVVSIETTNGILPSFTVATAPEDCLGVSIRDNEYVGAQITVKDTVSVSCTGEIKIRGNTSASAGGRKLPYKIKLSDPKDLLVRGNDSYKHRDWILLANAYTLQTETGMITSQLCGMPWQPAYQPVNLFLNGNWQGCYLLVESVDAGQTRIPVTDTGFIIEDDPYWWNADGAYFKTSHQLDVMGYTYKYPSPTKITEEQIDSIAAYMEAYESALMDDGEAFTNYIDVNPFASWILSHDVLGTWDAGGANMYLSKIDLNPNDPFSSKLTLGPVWDFDTCFIQTDAWARMHSSHIQYFDVLFQKEAFVKAYKDTWYAISGSLSQSVNTQLANYMDLYGAALQESWELEAARYGSNAGSIYDRHAFISHWFETRIDWLNEAIGGM